MHGRAARAIESLYSGAARESKAALFWPTTFEAGEHEVAAAYNLLAGNGATRLCSYAEARRRYAAARVSLDKLAPSPRQMRATVDILLQQIYTTLVADTAEQNFGRIAEARALLERLAQGSEASFGRPRALGSRELLPRPHPLLSQRDAAGPGVLPASAARRAGVGR